MVDDIDWLLIYLKVEETSFFLDQLRSHRRVPKLTLFYLSAFLSSARSVTFHVQSQVGTDEALKAKYRETCSQFLTGAVCKYFVKLRNSAEKEMHPRLSFALVEEHGDAATGQKVYTQRAGMSNALPSRRRLEWLEGVLNSDWPRASYTMPVWYIDDFPDGRKELIEACDEYFDRLRIFVEALRRELK